MSGSGLKSAESGGLVHAFELSDDTRVYFDRHLSREPDVLRRLRLETEALPMAELAVSPEQGQFLGMLVRLIGARAVLDVGFFRGYSALAMALALPDEGTIVAVERNEEYPLTGERYWSESGLRNRLDLRIGDALEVLGRMRRDERSPLFDLVFLDADKPRYPAYYPILLGLLKPGGLLVVDNAFWCGRVLDPSDQEASTEGVRELNRMIREDATVEAVTLPITDGMTLVRKPGL